jgi:hypothetical protein
MDSPVDQVLEWSRTVPHNGLIRYYMVGNMERVLVVSPKALGEVLVSKCYDFQKPEITRLQLSRITGRGLLISEGEHHKVSQVSRYPRIASHTNSLQLDTTEKPHARFFISSYQKFVPHFLV